VGSRRGKLLYKSCALAALQTPQLDNRHNEYTVRPRISLGAFFVGLNRSRAGPFLGRRPLFEPFYELSLICDVHHSFCDLAYLL